MAELLYAVEVVDAPQREIRFATVREGGYYGGIGDIIFVTSTKAFKKPQSTCRQIVDDLRAAATSGTSHAYLGSARVVCYHTDTKRWETVYTGKEAFKPRAQKAAPKNAQDSKGFWRVVPTTGFHQGPRETVFRAGFTGSDGYPKAIEIAGQTEYEIVEKMFNSLYVIHQEFVKTLPFSSPEDVAIAESEIAAANAPKVQRQYSAAELAAVPALDYNEWRMMHTEVYKKRYVMEPLFKAAADKMFANLDAIEKENQRKQIAEAEKKQLDAMRKQYEAEGGNNG
jgi:hypothetical protein